MMMIMIMITIIIITGLQEELQKLDKKMRKLLSIHGHHHPKADVDHLCIAHCTLYIVYSQKVGRKGPDALRRNLHIRIYKTVIIHRQQGKFTNTNI